jgi:gliding motility-associated protein GldM
MAGGNLSPRQKMINMMYLVLTALLALNVSKEVLDTFFEVNLGIVKTTESLDEKSKSTYSALKAFNNQKKSKPYIDLTEKIQTETDLLNLYIQEKKYNLVFTADGGEVYLGDYVEGDDEANKKLLSEEKDFNNINQNAKIGYLDAKSNRGAATTVFGPWTGPGKQIGTVGNQLKQNINGYRDFIINLLTEAKNSGLPLDENKLSALFKEVENLLTITEDQSYGKLSSKVTWEHHFFHDMPAVAALTLLTKLQSDIKNIEAEVASFLANSVGAEDLKFTTAQGSVIPSSNFVLKGEEFSAEIFLSAFDDQQKPEIWIGNYSTEVNKEGDTILVPSDNAYQMTDEDIKNGKGLYKVRASGTGEKTLTGFIKIKQEPTDKYYPFTKDYLVAGKSFSVSPTKMNVLYTGVKNPISVSVAGYQAKDISISFSDGSSNPTGKGTWEISPNGKKKKVSVKVSVKTKSGKRISMGSYDFRVKPKPQPTPNDDLEKERSSKDGKVSRTKIKSLSLSAVRKDFDFPNKVVVISFRCRITAGATPDVITCRGYNLNKKAKNIIGLLETGQSVMIDEIRVKEGSKEWVIPGAGFSYIVK